MTEEQKENLRVKAKARHEEKKSEASTSEVSVSATELAELRAELKALKESKSEKTTETVYVSESEKNTMMVPTDVPESDTMDEPKFFFAWTNYLFIGGYNDMGREFMPPYGRPIELKEMPPEIGRSPMGDRTETRRCRVKIWSKKMYNYLLAHPYYRGGVIYEDLGSLSAQDAKTYSFKMKAIGDVYAMNKRQVMTECKNHNINIGNGNDFDDMRSKLAHSLAAMAEGKQLSFSQGTALGNAGQSKKNEELLKKL